MSCEIDRVRIRQRVYTVLVMLALVTVATVSRSRADVELTVSPAMTRGAATAPVTIVEFADYQ
ncbi:MAG: hypothetical protein DMD81_17765 [Candidatus Rokuibacteriota bacterium]|nr:MAG: hypothetical protein DMD81_17765 [Candidatus Rokubacteria bacterium]